MASLAYQDVSARADVTDRYVLEFEWNFIESKLVHVIAIENLPTAVANLRHAERQSRRGLTFVLRGREAAPACNLRK
jgi:hypothetical protein